MAASPVFLFSPLIVQKLDCVNLPHSVDSVYLVAPAAIMTNSIDLKGFCTPLAMLPGLSSFVMLKEIVFATRHSLPFLSLTAAKSSVKTCCSAY